MITYESMAAKIGQSILGQIDKFQSEKKDFGQELVIPFKLPQIGGEPNFTYSIKLQMPRFSQVNLDGTITSFTMAEYYGWEKSKPLSSAAGFKFNPLQVVNTKYFITILDDQVLWGCKKMTFDELKSFEFKNCTSDWDKDEFKLNKKIITEMIRFYRKA